LFLFSKLEELEVSQSASGHLSVANWKFNSVSNSVEFRILTRASSLFQ
jgi:hypothetical protein